MHIVDRLLADHYDTLDLAAYGLRRRWETVLLTPRFVTSRHVVALVFARGSTTPALVVKIPRQPGDNAGVRHEAAVVGGLNRLGIGPGRGVPNVVGVLDAGGHTALVETALTGASLDPRRVCADPHHAIRAGEVFAEALPVTAEAGADGGWYHRVVVSPLEALASMPAAGPPMAGMIDRTLERLGPLQSAGLPAVVEHGDLSHPNLILSRGGVLQAADWERARMDGVPGHDLAFFLQYVSESLRGAFERPAQLRAFDAAFGPDGWAVDPLRRHLQVRGADPDIVPLLLVAVFARASATLADRLELKGSDATGVRASRAAVLADRDVWLWRHALDCLSRPAPNQRGEFTVQGRESHTQDGVGHHHTEQDHKHHRGELA